MRVPGDPTRTPKPLGIPPPWRLQVRNFELPGRSPVYTTTAMAATSHPLSTLSAMNVLRAGGNAVDAALAACAVQCVVEPGSTGVGGDCFMLYSPAGRADVIAYNGSGRTPAKCTLDWYVSHGVKGIERQSPHSITVPGAIEAWGRISSDWGSWGLGRVLEDAIRFAEEGYAVTPRVHRDWLQEKPLLERDLGSRAIYLPGGSVPATGSRHRNTPLAETLKKIANEGPRAFYEGSVARSLVTFLRNHGGLHTLEDFASAAGEYVDPIKTEFKGYDVWECPPNGQGVIALMLLNILSRSGSGAHALSDQRIHLEIEAARLAYNERNLFLGDPAHANNPVEWLLSDAHAETLSRQIDPYKAMSRLPAFAPPANSNTVYVSIVDRDRNAVSFINSLFDEFGSGLTDPQTGVLFHNRGQGFSLSSNHPNAMGPRKRPLHTLIPGMVTRAERVCMPFGVMGGHYQALGHAQFLSRFLEYGYDLQECADLPRIFPCLDTGNVDVESSLPDETVEALRRRGHRVARSTDPIGGAQAVWIDWENDVLIGASDPRKDGCALGY